MGTMRNRRSRRPNTGGRAESETNAPHPVAVPRLALLTAASLLLALSADAQPVAEPGVEALSAELRADQQAHLWRVGAWGLANALGGAVLVLATDRDDRPGLWAFGLQSGAWGVINVGIATVGLIGGPGEVAADWAAALAAENGYADILLVNLGLNVGYMAVGGTLLAVAGRGVPTPDAWRGHGAALVVQGLALLVLDGIAYATTRGRTSALVDLAGRAEVGVVGAGVGVVIGL